MEKVKMEGLYSLRGNAQMQYRYDIEHAPANLAPAEGRTAFIKGQRADAVIGMKSSTLQLIDCYRPSLLYINFSALFLLLFPNPILDVVGRHLPIRQIIPESSLFWGFYIVIG